MEQKLSRINITFTSVSRIQSINQNIERCLELQNEKNTSINIFRKLSEYLGQTINHKYYKEVPMKLTEKFRMKRLECKLQRVHNGQSEEQFLADRHIPLCDSIPYL